MAGGCAPDTPRDSIYLHKKPGYRIGLSCGTPAGGIHLRFVSFRYSDGVMPKAARNAL